ncbi:phosphotransferase [Limnobacter humi]|uniref:Phosphotransferase n=1 Tax=Limnobacter humi TaxID=1778671 RepID=A0ABT1WH91_9BURK|nr:phosphotransferase [Limnobacter humi]MCQ8896899.1 phosphotransferase [Limnobacter humi]
MSALRQELLEKWLESLPAHDFDLQTLAPASSDASFRRYFRVLDRRSGCTCVVMDAPPDKEDVRPFLAVAQLLRDGGVRAPQVFAEHIDQGFLLLEDFGGTTLLSALRASDTSTDPLYRAAIHDLVAMQANVRVNGLPEYSAAKLRAEMDLFDTWYVGKHFQSELSDPEKNWLDTIKSTLVDSALSEAQVFVHRDYHSRNLMVTGMEGSKPLLGMLDFQDAVQGPLSYDLVSILRDAYVEWPEDMTVDWAIRYWEQAKKAGLSIPGDASEFYRQFDFMGLQRHLKILGIFARLYHRDGKSQYLNDLPLVLAYVRSVASRYMAFKPLLLVLDRLENKAVKVGYTF